MHSVIERILADGPVVTDGAWGTQLQERGLAVGEFPDIWNVTHADKVEEVARAYVEAGSQVILTNTFGANRIRLSGHADEWVGRREEINRRGVEISRRAAGNSCKVFASIGPTGKLMLDPEMTPEGAHEAFSEQAACLARAGADGLLVESMSDLEEAKLAVAAAKLTGLPVIVSLVFDTGKDQDRTMMGTTVEEAAEALAEIGADVIGANCGRGAADFARICRRMHQATHLPLWMKANAGLPEWEDGRARYRITPEEFARHASDWIEAGASFIGGCCGTSPEFVREMGRQLGRRRPG